MAATPPTPPSPTWLMLGRNAYGEAVEENPTGQRRVATERGWEAETALPGWRACRAKSNEDAHYALQSMAAPWVSAGFQHNLRRAYVAYRLEIGQPLSSAPSHWATENDPRWKAFEKGVQRARGERVLRAWLRRRPVAPDVPRWDMVLAAPSATATRGLQWGLAHRLEAWAAENPDVLFWEMGLVDAADAATSRLASGRRRAWSARAGALWAPASEVLQGWPTIPGNSNAFGAKAVSTWPEGVAPVVWVTPASLKAHGELGNWWVALAKRERGVVVFSESPQGASALGQALRAEGRVPGRWKIPGHGEVWSWGWGLDRQDQPLPMEQWAVPQEPAVEQAENLGEDEKVAYRALSRVTEPEGMASRALEANMHAALSDFARHHGNVGVDEWVAEGLGVPVETLGRRLGPEQVDAVALARQSLEDDAGFILSDETGFGKGRTLASLALTGLREGKTVVFITENHFLFSDFFRDLSAVSDGRLPTPTLLHQAAHVKAPDGTTLAKSLKSKAFKEMLVDREWEDGEDRLIMTTYAQLSRTYDDQKVRWLKDRMGRQGWLLLDEAHNAAGDESSVGKRVEELTKAAVGTVYGSATFAKREANLGLYAPVMRLPPAARRLLRLALAGDNGPLREALTQQMARAGRLVRREHPPVPPPEAAWVSLTEERTRAVQAFGQGWRYMFDAAAAFSRLRGVRDALWMQLGAALSRSVKEFGLQLKADALVEFIQSKVEEDKKVVVVVDSTMEAALRDALTPSEEDLLGESEEVWEDDGAAEGTKAAPPQMVKEGEGEPPLWRDRLRTILDEVCPRVVWEGQSSPEAEAARRAYTLAEQALLSLPDWDLAPLDRVRRNLDEHSIPNSELSGRQTRLMINPKGWNVIPRNDPDRNDVVRSFNSGEIDVLFVTRAGCAGISLHAGKTFKDQRIRCLVEWDIAANPVNRVQFWGRVRRKDQIIEPEFFGLVLDTPEDRRIMEREDRKRRQMLAHMGANPAEQVGWLSELGESLVEEWAIERVPSAFRIGVSRPLVDNPLGRVDRALVRSLVLPPVERERLLMRLERGVQLGAESFVLTRQNRSTLPSRAIRRAWWWGDPKVSLADPALALSSLRLDVVERIWRPQAGASAAEVATAVRQAHGQQPTGTDVLNHWRAAWIEEAKKGTATTVYRKRVADWAQQHLPRLSVGQALTFTHPGLERPVRAVVVGWSWPSAAVDLNGASAWALSQVAIDVWAVGDREPLLMPLSLLASDAAFQSLGKPASPAWFDAPPVPYRGVTVEGHPVQAAAWGRRWGVGRSALINDEDEGPQVVWLLPPSHTWETVMAKPRDLIDTEHALAFWREHPTETLEATLPEGQRFIAHPVEGGLRLAIEENTLKSAAETWMHPTLSRRFRFRPVFNERGWLETPQPIAWKKVVPLLHGLATAGIGWRVPARYLGWYLKTAPERTRAKA